MKTSVHPMMSVLLTALTSLVVTKAAMAQDPVQVASQNYKVLFENDRARVLEYRSKPGEKAEMHSHPDYLIYDLGSGYKIQLTFPDGKVKTIEGKAGTVSWHDAVTHALENVGTIDAHALLIELKK
jgi:quercetin dioxygenase-like cupin family protein